MTDQIDALCNAAEDYRALKLKPIPLTDGKTPAGIPEWELTDFPPAALRSRLHKAKVPGIGIQLGPCSGLIDVEWDGEAQRAKAYEIFGSDLLDTCPAFGRPGDPLHGHRLFAWDKRLEALGKANFSVLCGDKSKLIIRIGVGPNPGTQSAFPPSPNKEWLPGRELEDCTPLPLPDSVIDKLLASRKPAAAKKSQPTSKPPVDDAATFKAAVVAMTWHTPPADEKDGSKRLHDVCCRAVEYNLTDEAAIAAVRKYAETHPFPHTWTDEQILDRVRDAEQRTDCERGSASHKRFYLCTDHGNSERFAAQHAENVRYCYDWKQWLVWDGRRWKKDNSGAVVRLAKRTARSIFDEAKRCDDHEGSKMLAKWAIKSDMRSGTSAMIAHSESEEPIPIAVSSLDAEPWLLNFENGTLDLRTGKLREHRREDFLTACCSTEYAESGKPTKWLKFLDQIFNASKDLIEFNQRLVGASLVGVVREQNLPIHYGVGANGKSTFFLVIAGLLGEDYAIVTDSNFLIASKHERHPTELADLFSKRLVVSFESGKDAPLNEERVKRLTGKDKIRARRMGENFFEFAPSHSLHLATNFKPRIVGGDHAIWRRVQLIPYTVVIPDEEQIKDFDEVLKEEWPQIARWCVEGCLAWQRDGLQPPKEVLAATAEYRAESDLLTRFLDDCCEFGKQYSVGATALFHAWSGWLSTNNEQMESQIAFNKRMAARQDLKKTAIGHEKTRTYLGIQLKLEDFE